MCVLDGGKQALAVYIISHSSVMDNSICLLNYTNNAIYSQAATPRSLQYERGHGRGVCPDDVRADTGIENKFTLK